MWKKKFDKVLAQYGNGTQAGRYGLALCWAMKNSAEWLDDDDYLTLYDKLLYRYSELMNLMVGKGWNVDIKSLSSVIPEGQLEKLAEDLMGE